MTVGMFGGAAFAASSTTQPAADPPAELGEAYAVDGVTVTPADKPFDDVGLAVVETGSETTADISMAHRTLPLPSYAEVTALDNGRTILVRIERRGPLSGPAFVALSAGAFAQLGADPAQPLGVRVRRVSPQEYERSLLRTGQRAPERLATPKPLLEVLRRRLAAKDPSSVPSPGDAVVPARTEMTDTPPLALPAKPLPSKGPAPRSKGSYEVQVGAFANRSGAESTAKKLGGTVSSAGKLWRVRTGPFDSRAEAGAAQTRARKAGFADAQIVTAQVPADR